MADRHLRQREVRRGQRFPDFVLPVIERVVAPEIIGPQKPAVEQVIAQVRRFFDAEVRAARLRHHEERTVIDLGIGQPVDAVIEVAGQVAADGSGGELGESITEILVGARPVDGPSAAVAVHRVVEHDAAEHERAVVVRVGRQPEVAEPPAAPLRRRAGRRDRARPEERGRHRACEHPLRFHPAFIPRPV